MPKNYMEYIVCLKAGRDGRSADRLFHNLIEWGQLTRRKTSWLTDGRLLGIFSVALNVWVPEMGHLSPNASRTLQTSKTALYNGMAPNVTVSLTCPPVTSSSVDV